MTTPNDSREIRIKRLRMRAWHRGTREMDLILGQWADAHLAQADERTLDVFETILGESDLDLYQWISGQRAAPEPWAPFLAQFPVMHSTATKS